jgi:hypothetical protein
MNHGTEIVKTKQRIVFTLRDKKLIRVDASKVREFLRRNTCNNGKRFNIPCKPAPTTAP